MLDELIADDCLDYSAPPGSPTGLEGVKQFFTMFRSAFPDLSYKIEDQIAEGDKVMTRTTWHGTHQGTFLVRPILTCF